MPLKLLYDVAKVQYERSGRPRDHGVNRNVHVYALNGMAYCAHCEKLAAKHNNPKLRSRLSGDKLRYRHKNGVICGCTNKSVPGQQYEADFGRLIKLLTIKPDALSLMTELAIQAGEAAESGQRGHRPRSGKARCDCSLQTQNRGGGQPLWRWPYQPRRISAPYGTE
jgi:hypothetical protein